MSNDRDVSITTKPQKRNARRAVRYADDGAKLVPSHAVVPYQEGHVLLSSLTSQLTALEYE